MIQISVIVPLYKGKCYIEPMIEQIYVAAKKVDGIVELLFVNDYPKELIDINEKKDNLLIRTIKTEKNRGIHGARAYGYNESNGEFVLFLDQDDEIVEDYFESQLLTITSADAVVCQGEINDELIYPSFEIMQKLVNKQKILSERNYIISPGQVLIKRKAVSRFWLENIIHNNGADDWFLWLCMFNESKKMVLNDKLLYRHVLHNKNTSANVLNMYSSVVEVGFVVRKSNLFSKNIVSKICKATDLICNDLNEIYDRQQNMNGLYSRWIQLQFNNRSIGSFIKRYGYKSVAIYGAGEIGTFILRDLKKDGIEIEYFVDRKKSGIIMKKKILSPNDNLPHVDLFIISLLQNEESVKSLLKEFGMKNIYTINEIIDLLYGTL